MDAYVHVTASVRKQAMNTAGNFLEITPLKSARARTKPLKFKEFQRFWYTSRGPNPGLLARRLSEGAQQVLFVPFGTVRSKY